MKDKYAVVDLALDESKDYQIGLNFPRKAIRRLKRAFNEHHSLPRVSAVRNLSSGHTSVASTETQLHGESKLKEERGEGKLSYHSRLQSQSQIPSSTAPVIRFREIPIATSSSPPRCVAHATRDPPNPLKKPAKGTMKLTVVTTQIQYFQVVLAEQDAGALGPVVGARSRMPSRFPCRAPANASSRSPTTTKSPSPT